MADERKLCNKCQNINSRQGFFPNTKAEDCILVINKFTINKETYDAIKAYWEKRLRNNETMEHDCPGFGQGAI